MAQQLNLWIAYGFVVRGTKYADSDELSNAVDLAKRYFAKNGCDHGDVHELPYDVLPYCLFVGVFLRQVNAYSIAAEKMSIPAAYQRCIDRLPIEMARVTHAVDVDDEAGFYIFPVHKLLNATPLQE